MLSTQLRPARSRISLYGFNSGDLDWTSRGALSFHIFDNLRRVARDWAGPVFAARKHSNRPARVQTGLDVLEAEKFGAATRQTRRLDHQSHGSRFARAQHRRRFVPCGGFQLIALFSPEHGLAGRNDERVSSTKDPSLAFPLQSLWGDPASTEEMLKGIDALGLRCLEHFLRGTPGLP